MPYRATIFYRSQEVKIFFSIYRNLPLVILIFGNFLVKNEKIIKKNDLKFIKVTNNYAATKKYYT